MAYTQIPCTSPLLPSPRQTDTKTGIGGRGNYHTISTLPIPIPIPSSTRTISPSRSFHTGIGGAGNRKGYESCSSFTLLKAERAARRENMKIRAEEKLGFYTGIGGSGNRWFNSDRGEGSRGNGFESESESESESFSSVRGSKCGVVGGSNADKMKSGVAGLFGKA